MDVQFFVSVVLMSISALAILLATRLRQEDWQINAAMNCLVKGTDFSTLSNADVQRVENKLNSRPRKILGYQTPREVFLIAA